MATHIHITSAEQWFTGTARVILFEILDIDRETPLDMTGAALQWVLRTSESAPDALLTKDTTVGGVTITGVYDSDRTVNTQRVAVQIDAADTASLAPDVYVYGLKRTDDGLEDVLAYGDATLLQVAAH